jgi:hypothetical protein
MSLDRQTLQLIAEHLQNPDRPDGEFTAQDGRRWRTRRRPAPGVRAILESAEPDRDAERMLTIFDPATDRPADYPDDLPFLPGAVAIVHETLATIPPSTAVLWSEMSDSMEFAGGVIRASEAEGWEVTSPLSQPIPFVGARSELRHGTRRRLLTAMALGASRVVMLLQTSEPVGSQAR